jgi:hypothetical protein
MQSTTEVRPAAERYYRVKEIAERWSLASSTVPKPLRDEPGVSVIGLKSSSQPQSNNEPKTAVRHLRKFRPCSMLELA